MLCLSLLFKTLRRWAFAESDYCSTKLIELINFILREKSKLKMVINVAKYYFEGLYVRWEQSAKRLLRQWSSFTHLIRSSVIKITPSHTPWQKKIELVINVSSLYIRFQGCKTSKLVIYLNQNWCVCPTVNYKFGNVARLKYWHSIKFCEIVSSFFSKLWHSFYLNLSIIYFYKF